MSTSFSLLSALRHSLVLAVFAGSALSVAGAQAVPASSSAKDAPGVQPYNLFTSAPAASGSANDALFSSSVSNDFDDAGSNAPNENLASLEKNFALPNANAQYGGRRRYGSPRYRGSNTNADGSEKYTFFAGAGLTVPLGNTHHYYTPSYDFQVGAGRNFNKNFGLNLEFDWDNFGLQGSTLTQQSYIYDPTGALGIQGILDGHSHVWSLSLDPIYNLKSGEGVGAYVTGGVGFYHKTTTFTVPETVEGYDYYGFPVEYEANEPIDSYTSNAPGVDAGFGLTYKFSRFANERFYAEARYVVTFNSQRAGINGSNYNSYAPGYDYPTYNLFPANSNRSTYLPIKFGIRF